MPSITAMPNNAMKPIAAETLKGMSKASDRIDSLTGRLNDFAEGKAAPKMAKNMAKGDSPVKAGVKATASKVKDTVKGKLGGLGGSGNKLKVTNIVESIDLPVRREVAYQQWTQFEEFPKLMKKVENVSQEEDQKLKWQAQIFWSHRTWEATIVDQVPNERIVWKSEGEKGHVDGAVTFHELAPDLTRMLMVLEYHPKGLFEHTGNIWRAQGRRARLELKHFRRHVATQTLLHQDELEGWGGEIHDGEVTSKGDEAGDTSKSEETSEETSEEKSSKRQAAKGKGGGRPASKTAKGRQSKSRSGDRQTAKKSPAKKTQKSQRSRQSA